MKILAFLFFFPSLVIAQPSVSFKMGGGTYLMTELKGLQDEVLESFPVPMKKISSYPPYVTYEVGVATQTPGSFFWGIIYGYGSTGARMSYSDYSGSILYDQRAKYFSVTSSLGIVKKFSGKTFQLGFDLRPTVIFTHFDMSFVYAIGAEVGKDEAKFRSTNLAVQPTVTFTRRFGRFGAEALAGVNVNILRGKLHLPGEKELYLTRESGSPLRADWTGLRVGLGMSYHLTAE
jgi:hypothetical protein